MIALLWTWLGCGRRFPHRVVWVALGGSADVLCRRCGKWPRSGDWFIDEDAEQERETLRV